MTRPERLLKRAEREAKKVSYRWRLGCVISLRGNVLSSGKSTYRHHPSVHPLQATFHAEEVAIRRLTRKGS